MPYAPASLVVLLAAVGLAAGQERTPKKDVDPQSAIEPRSAPGVGQKFLGRFVGDWDVVKTFHPRSGPPARATGECRQHLIHGGRFLQSDFVFRSGDATTTGTGLVGFEPATGKFTSVWTDSRATRMSFRQSQEPFGGNEIVLHARGFGPDERQSRTVTRLEEDGRKIVHRQYSAAADGQDRLVMELILTRKSSSSAR